MAPRLGYWKTRTLGNPIRLLLAYTGTEFEDYHHIVKDPPHYDKSHWFSVKYKLGLDFPNLPYYIDGDVKLSQSIAILRYIGRKHNLCGRTEEEQIRLDMLIDQAMDFGVKLWDITYDHMEQKEDYLKTVPPKLKAFSDFLGDKPWFVSKQGVTIAEFLMYEFLDHHLVFHPPILEEFPQNIRDFMTRFCGLPRIKEYMASPAHLKEPIFNVYSQFMVQKREKMKKESGK